MSDLAKAFAGLKQAQEPEHPGTQTLKNFVRAGQRARAAVDKLTGPRLAPLPLQGTAKNSHPEFKAVKVFLRKATHKAAARKWEDEAAGDFSDLVELLLKKYLGT